MLRRRLPRRYHRARPCRPALLTTYDATALTLRRPACGLQPAEAEYAPGRRWQRGTAPVGRVRLGLGDGHALAPRLRVATSACDRRMRA